MITTQEQQLLDAMAALGRPELVLSGPLHLRMASIRRVKDWDAAHPTEALEHARLRDIHEKVVNDAIRAERETAIAERAMNRLADRMERAGVGERSAAAAAEPDESYEAFRVVREWLATSTSWLVLCGQRGTGKSVASTWAVREILRRGDSAALKSIAYIASLSSFESGAVELEYLQRVALLVLDDAGTEQVSSHTASRLHQLLDARHEAYGRTIISSNIRWSDTDENTHDGLVSRLGERIVDRIAQSGRVVQLAARPSGRRKPKVES